MNRNLLVFAVLAFMAATISCNRKPRNINMNILFLHHSTGGVIWRGAPPSTLIRAANKLSPRLAQLVDRRPCLPLLFERYSAQHEKHYVIMETAFPKSSPYGWHNYPYDYYNIWVKHAGDKLFMDEPTLEMLTKQHQVIIFKHCFPVSNIQPDTGSPDIDSDYKSLANYKLQYLSLRAKLHDFPKTKFIVWTGAAQVKSQITQEEATRAREFFRWVTEIWDLPGDNIFIWDFYRLQTEGGLYFKDNYAKSTSDSHPNAEFARRATDLFFNRVVDVIEQNGEGTTLIGEKKHSQTSFSRPVADRLPR